MKGTELAAKIVRRYPNVSVIITSAIYLMVAMAVMAGLGEHVAGSEDAELRWLGAALSEARDSEVLRRHLDALPADCSMEVNATVPVAAADKCGNPDTIRQLIGLRTRYREHAYLLLRQEAEPQYLGAKRESPIGPPTQKPMTEKGSRKPLRRRRPEPGGETKLVVQEAELLAGGVRTRCPAHTRMQCGITSMI